MISINHMSGDQSRRLTTGQAARLCSVKPDTVLKWIKSGRLHAGRTAGGHFRIEWGDIERLIPTEGNEERPSAPPVECSPQPLRCWEYLSDRGAVRETCKQCVVYRVRAAWCFQVAGLGEGTGHIRQFCHTSCEDCAYYRRVRGLASNVLVVTSDEQLAAGLSGDKRDDLSFRFARNAYEAGAVISEFRPGIAVVDWDLTAWSASELIACLAHDTRVPGLRVIVALRPDVPYRGIEGANQEIVAGTVRKPVTSRQIRAVIDSLPVELVCGQ
jgi:excisionase family DNA binding protein